MFFAGYLLPPQMSFQIRTICSREIQSKLMFYFYIYCLMNNEGNNYCYFHYTMCNNGMTTITCTFQTSGLSKESKAYPGCRCTFVENKYRCDFSRHLLIENYNQMSYFLSLVSVCVDKRFFFLCFSSWIFLLTYLLNPQLYNPG